MIEAQKLTPKYWVGHRNTDEDVFLDTASKTFSVSVQKMEELFGEDWFMDEGLEVILVEVASVKR